jgi:hypothetical protein
MTYYKNLIYHVNKDLLLNEENLLLLDQQVSIIDFIIKSKIIFQRLRILLIFQIHLHLCILIYIMRLECFPKFKNLTTLTRVAFTCCIKPIFDKSTLTKFYKTSYDLGPYFINIMWTLNSYKWIFFKKCFHLNILIFEVRLDHILNLFHIFVFISSI